MDFKPSKVWQTTSRALSEVMDRTYKAHKDAEPKRKYLGGSMIGRDCEREIAYQYHGAPLEPREDGIVGFLHQRRVFDIGAARGAGGSGGVGAAGELLPAATAVAPAVSSVGGAVAVAVGIDEVGEALRVAHEGGGGACVREAAGPDLGEARGAGIHQVFLQRGEAGGFDMALRQKGCDAARGFDAEAGERACQHRLEAAGRCRPDPGRDKLFDGW